MMRRIIRLGIVLLMLSTTLLLIEKTYSSTQFGDATITASGGQNVFDSRISIRKTSDFPYVNLYRNDGAPVDSTWIGVIDFEGPDSGGVNTVYARILGYLIDTTSGTEDGRIYFRTMSAGTETNIAYLHQNMNAYGNGTFSDNAFDLAEDYPVKDNLSFEAGEIVSINEEFFVEKATKSTSRNVIGVVSDHAAQLSNTRLKFMDNGIYKEGYLPIALIGRVKVKVCVDNGDISVGDYLTTSSTEGVAAKAIESGIVIGKALENYMPKDKDENGVILMYVNVGWFEPYKEKIMEFTAIDKIIEEAEGILEDNSKKMVKKYE